MNSCEILVALWHLGSIVRTCGRKKKPAPCHQGDEKRLAFNYRLVYRCHYRHLNMSPEGLCVALGGSFPDFVCHHLQTRGCCWLNLSAHCWNFLVSHQAINMQLHRLSGREGVQSVLVPVLLGLFCHTNLFEAQVSVAVSWVDGAFRRSESR